ncbi:PucR family transcriptional regulator [Amycolatopsis sp. H20-H5]|uniref:PucR family transcriptional regulator n=1 Tax=Amycolatopsis sp. H20-H5 TaxID=3046309 RepID=UPI002DB6DC67|nr:helix-turn-helix domain-containing protein [Amycolatopsis sp. H20-H5]MEC3975556.1 helix-turn-helix domain-containing protein [Amycolatopsis sp. H20-H5]
MSTIAKAPEPAFTSITREHQQTPSRQGTEYYTSAADFRARVRAAGECWDGDRPSVVVDELIAAAAADPRLSEIVLDGQGLLRDFLEGRLQAGVDEIETRDLAGDLIDDHLIARQALHKLADDYTVILVDKADPDADCAALREHVGPETLTTCRSTGLVLLVPEVEAGYTAKIIRRLDQHLAGSGWITSTIRPKSSIACGYQEVVDVMKLVRAARRPSGMYCMSDVLIEYAVIHDSRVRQALVSIIFPLREHPILCETLNVMIDSDHNRKKAARELLIHRSTLDYRLARIANITGRDPRNPRDAQLLSAAMIADNLSDQAARTERFEAVLRQVRG